MKRQIEHFQSPPFGASHCNMRKPKYGLWTSSSFSPLHSGQATAIIQDSPGKQLIVAFQSPPFGASHCNLICFCCTAICVSPFSPLHSGQATAITSLIVSALNSFPLSVPSIRGKQLQSFPFTTI